MNSLRLFLNKKIKCVHQCASLEWKINNDAQPTQLHSIQIELRDTEYADTLTCTPARAWGYIPNGGMVLSTPLTFTQSGVYILAFIITARDANDAIVQWTTQEMPFEFELPTDTAHDREVILEIEGSVLKNTNIFNIPAKKLHVKAKENFLKELNSQQPHQAQPTATVLPTTPTPSEQQFEECTLTLLVADGLYPLKLEQLTTSWQQQRQTYNGVALCYVNAHQQAIEQTHNGALMELKIQLHTEGYLLLVGRGTSGKYYQFYPNTTAAQTGKLPQQTVYFPSAALLNLKTDPYTHEKTELCFSSTGQETMFALLSTKPLAIEPWHIDCENIAMCTLEPQQLRNIIENAIKAPENSVFMALAQLQVT